MVEAILMIMLLLVAGFVGTRVANTVRMPHSVFLVFIGVAAGLAIRHFDPHQVASLEHLFPEIILFVLLPPLIFESAYNFDLKDLKKDLFPISFYAVIALCASTAIIGFSMHYLFHLSLIPSLTFGALISATDPVAVVALFKKIGAPKRLNALIEGESLLNDGAAIVLFRVLVGFVAVTTFESSMITEGMQQFMIVAFGGALVGLGFYYATSLLLKITSDSSAQLGLTIASAYSTFIVADHFLHVSGVIATMVVGLLLGHRARLEFNKEALHGMHYIWEFLALAANTIVFFGVGLSVDPVGLKESYHLILPTLGLVYFARAFVVYGFSPLVNVLRLSEPISFGYQTLMIWGGLRGGLALALVLLLPHDFPHRQLFLSLASAVVLSSLFVNALTIERMMGWLGLKELSDRDKRSYLQSLKKVISASIKPFEEGKSQGLYSSDIVQHQQNLLQNYWEQKESGIQGTLKSSENQILEELQQALLEEKALYNHNLAEGFLSKKAYISLTESFEKRNELLEEEKLEVLKAFPFGKIMESKKSGLSLFTSHSKFLALKLETLLHLKLALEELSQKPFKDEVKDVLAHWMERAEKSLEKFYGAYPDETASVQTQYISGAVSSKAESKVHHLVEEQLISAAVATRLKKDFETMHELQIEESKKLLNPSMSYLLKRVPIFGKAPNALIEEICSKVHKQSFRTGETVVTEGEEGHSFYLVTSGILEVTSQFLEESQMRPRLYVGDFFGELSLLLGKPRGATVTAVADAQLLELHEKDFHEILEKYPEIKSEVMSVAELRQSA
ncbi:MAG: hypothetical protein CL676_04315 [Bdellovibrionaceae bacterium]|nr:hypothetical protein [Pseudobdellovibrionaceae bacterium]|tara:strand:- start:2797 stop:5172 length:2376 start_codon:yes stop_codon:yes gene_type:complete